MRWETALFATLLLACERRAPPTREADATGDRVAPTALASASPEPSARADRSAQLQPSAAPSASAPLPARPAPERSPPRPAALLDGPPRPAEKHAGLTGPVDPAKDVVWLTRMATAPVNEITRNPGGATITFRVRFADGNRAVWKPEQKHSASNYRAEIAAYHLDRIVGFARTAAVVGRTLGYPHVIEHLEASAAAPEFIERFRNEVPARDGRVAGAMIAWHSGRLTSAEPPKGWTTGLRSADEVPSDVAGRLPEWSDLVVFDFLIDNTDRWSGGNVLALGGGPLIFLDNAAGFSAFRDNHGETTEKRLAPICRFRRATIETLRTLGPDAASGDRLGARLGRSLANDPLAPLVGAAQLRALDIRVERLLAHVEGCEKELGAATVLSL